MTVHNALTGSELHETKGAAAALQGMTLVANGVGQALYQKHLGNEVWINSEADFPTPSGGVITLAANTRYVIGTAITTSNRFALSANVTITCGDTNGPLLDYTGTDAMFTGTSVNFNMHQAHFTCAAGTFLDLTGGFLRMDNTTVDATNKDADLTDVIGIVISRCSFLASNQGADFLGSNTVAILSLEKLRYVTTSATSIMVDLNAIVFSTLEIRDITVTAPAGAIGISGVGGSANMAADKLAVVESVEFDPLMTPISGISITDVRWHFAANSGLSDSIADAMLSLTANATSTVLSVGVPTLVAGTFVDERASMFTNTAAGRATYNGERDLVVPIDACMTLAPDSGTAKVIRAYIALNGTAIAASGKAIQVDTGDPLEITLMWQLNLAKDDFIEVFIENETDSIDVTVTDAVLRIR